MKDITIKVTISGENVQAVIDAYKDFTGKEPSKRWLTNFLRLDVTGLANETFCDGLEDAVEACVDVD